MSGVQRILGGSDGGAGPGHATLHLVQRFLALVQCCEGFVQPGDGLVLAVVEPPGDAVALFPDLLGRRLAQLLFEGAGDLVVDRGCARIGDQWGDGAELLVRPVDQLRLAIGSLKCGEEIPGETVGDLDAAENVATREGAISFGFGHELPAELVVFFELGDDFVADVQRPRERR